MFANFWISLQRSLGHKIFYLNGLLKRNLGYLTLKKQGYNFLNARVSYKNLLVQLPKMKFVKCLRNILYLLLLFNLAIWGALNDISYAHKQNIICDTIKHTFSHHWVIRYQEKNYFSGGLPVYQYKKLWWFMPCLVETHFYVLKLEF